jgi:hypothetical protein
MNIMYIELHVTYLKMCIRPKCLGPHGPICEIFYILLYFCRYMLQYLLSEIV